MHDEYSGELAPALRDSLARLAAAPGASGVLIVVYTHDFTRSTVATTVPKHLQASTLRALLERADPPRLIALS